MKVTHFLPRPVEAKVGIDAKAGEVAIEPLFVRGVACGPVGHIEVAGDGGRTRRYALEVNGRNGRLVLRELKVLTPAYDKEEAES